MKLIRIRNLSVSAAAVAATTLCLAMATAPASVAAGRPNHPATTHGGLPDGMSRQTFNLMIAQMPLDKAATKIQALAAAPGAGHSGFFETRVDQATHTLTVYWHGRVPADVRSLIRTLDATVHIRVTHTRYSLAALNRDIATALHTPGVVGGYPATDGSGIHLNVRSGNPRTLASTMRSQLGVPVVTTRTGTDRLQTCTLYPSDTLNAGSRCYDLPAFWGGAVIESYNSTFDAWIGCTSGFGVHNSSGGTYIMTAAHCSDNLTTGYVNGITFKNGQNSSTIGQTTDVPGTHDGALIPTSAGTHYYDGPGIKNGDTYNTKIVAGQQATSVGDSLCESGAFGGVKCGFKVTALNFSEIDQDYPSQTWNAMALASSSGSYTINGDSGGPWFSLDGCCTYVWAKGIHHGLIPVGSGYDEVFTPITVISSDTGTSVNHG